MSDPADRPDGTEAEAVPHEPTAPTPLAPDLAVPEPSGAEGLTTGSAVQEPAATPAPTPTPDVLPTDLPPPEAPPELAPPPVSGWVPPEGGGSADGRRRGCLIAVVVLGALLGLGVIGLIFLGNQALSILGGTIQFGTGGSGCSVTGSATTFPASASIHSVAFLKKDVPAGTTVTTFVTFADGTSQSTDETFDTTARCVTQEIDSGLPPGHYGLEYHVGPEVVAKGAFDITP